jgi:hypothetical protein
MLISLKYDVLITFSTLSEWTLTKHVTSILLYRVADEKEVVARIINVMFEPENRIGHVKRRREKIPTTTDSSSSST